MVNIPENVEDDADTITWSFDSIKIVAKQSDSEHWDVYVEHDDVIVSGLKQNVRTADLMLVVNELKVKYYDIPQFGVTIS